MRGDGVVAQDGMARVVQVAQAERRSPPQAPGQTSSASRKPAVARQASVRQM